MSAKPKTALVPTTVDDEQFRELCRQVAESDLGATEDELLLESGLTVHKLMKEAEGSEERMRALTSARHIRLDRVTSRIIARMNEALDKNDSRQLKIYVDSLKSLSQSLGFLYPQKFGAGAAAVEIEKIRSGRTDGPAVNVQINLPDGTRLTTANASRVIDGKATKVKN